MDQQQGAGKLVAFIRLEGTVSDSWSSSKSEAGMAALGSPPQVNEGPLEKRHQTANF